MSEGLHLPLILLAALVASASPGPATLAIAGASMGAGRRCGMALAGGVMAGSLAWSVTAALGFGALMLAHGWILEAMRYAGAGYLLYLALRSARSAMRKGAAHVSPVLQASTGRYFTKGLLLHLTNPKAILFFGSLYSIGIPRDASAADIATVVAAVGVQSGAVFFGYAALFSNPAMLRAYGRLRRWFEAAFAALFGAAAVAILGARLS
ncbi:MAG: LysE family translocator [Flavobacteriaceae bacterium]